VHSSSAGRVAGILLIAEMAGSGLVNFYLEAPLFGPGGFLPAAAAHAQQIGAAALLGLALGAIWLGIAITVFPASFQRSQRLTLWLLALATAGLAAAVLESAALLSMLSLSEAWTSASGSTQEQLAAVQVMVHAARNWAHYLGRFLDGITALAFYLTVLRARLAPTVLAALGMVAAPVMAAGVVLPVLGHDVVFPMLAPLGLAHLLLALWLIVRGFRLEPATSQALSTA
jgi:hypothetical protein